MQKAVKQATEMAESNFKAVTATSDTLYQFLNDNGDHIIQVANTGATVLALLARFAPEYPCLLQGLADSEPPLEQAFGGAMRPQIDRAVGCDQPNRHRAMAGALRGLQDTRMPMLLALTGYWIFGFGTSVVLGFRTPLAGLGVWIGLAVGLVVVAGLLLVRWVRREGLGLVPAYPD